jgi:hypothetical protein
VAPRGGDHARDFIALERLRENVISAAVQHLGPKLFVGGARSHNQLRRTRQAVEIFKHLFPIPIRDVATGNYDVYGVAIQAFEGFLPAAGFEQTPTGLAKDFVHEQPTVFALTYQQCRDRMIALTCHERTLLLAGCSSEAAREPVSPDFSLQAWGRIAQ